MNKAEGLTVVESLVKVVFRVKLDRSHQVEFAFEIAVLVIADATSVVPFVAVFDFGQMDVFLTFHETQ